MVEAEGDVSGDWVRGRLVQTDRLRMWEDDPRGNVWRHVEGLLLHWPSGLDGNGVWRWSHEALTMRPRAILADPDCSRVEEAQRLATVAAHEAVERIAASLPPKETPDA